MTIRVKGSFIRASKLNKDGDCIRYIGEAEIELPIDISDILQAVSRGYCTKENKKKEMDAVLGVAIANEVITLLTGSTPMVEKEGKEEFVETRGIKQKIYFPKEEKRSCENCVNPCKYRGKTHNVCNEWQGTGQPPKEKIDWDKLKQNVCNENLHTIEFDEGMKKFFDIVRSLYEKVEGLKEKRNDH